MAKNNRYIISLGGSLIVPNEIDTGLLKNFQKIIASRVAHGEKFILITGGGRTSRRYTDAAKKLGQLNNTDLDWLGIHATRLNGHLLRTIFRKYAQPQIIDDPTKKINDSHPVIIAAGYRPGWSTDYVSVLLAQKHGAHVMVNLSNVDYVYDKDPRQFKDAKPIKNISWVEFRKIVGNKWDPGLHVPFDPVASKLAQKINLKVVIMNGKNFSNFQSFLLGKEFKGTVIS